MSADASLLKVGYIVQNGPNSGLIYGGAASDGRHHLLVEPEDAKDEQGERLILTFEEAVAHASRKKMEVPRRADLNLLFQHADAIGGFDRSHNGWYWSASEVNDVIAWIQRFSDGCQDFHIKLFADKDFDGEPVQIYEPGENDPIAPPDDAPTINEEGEPLPDEPGADETIVDGQPDLPDAPGPITGGGRRKVYVDGVGATIVAERVEYLDEHGKLVTESLRDFTKTAIRKRVASLDDFLKRWKAAERKQAIVDELEAEGLPLGPIGEELGKNLDPFDLICHIAFEKKPLTR